jgi:flavin reductase (DIM6/NTAB) family NADH-FMN oxidoreductase RutF
MANSETPLSLDLKQAMRRMAASVTIISVATAEGRSYAMTATAVTSLSLEVPSLLICVNQRGGIHPALIEGMPFCVNVLSNDQRQLAELCSVGPETRDRFAQGQWQYNTAGIPYLADALANIFCLNDKHLCYASHTVFIGRVENVTIQGPVSPLIYLDGSYLVPGPLQN